MIKNGFVAAVMEAEKFDIGGWAWSFQYYKGTSTNDFAECRLRVYQEGYYLTCRPHFSEFTPCKMAMMGMLPRVDHVN